MVDRRVQAQELSGPEALRPTGPPPDTYAPPARPEQDDRLAKLGEALGTFNTGLHGFGRAYMIDQRYHKDGAETSEMDQAKSLQQKYNSEEFNKAVDSGAIPRFATPKAQAAIDYTYGQNIAHQTELEFNKKLAAGELRLEDGSAQTWLHEKRDEVSKTNNWAGEGPGPGRGFSEGMNTLWDRARDGAVKANIGIQKEKFDTAVFQQVEMFADKATTNKWDAATSWQELTKLKTQLQDAMHLQPKEADQKLMLALGRRMAVDPNWVVDMATTPRPDVKGNGMLPPLSETPEYADQVASWQKQAIKFNSTQAQASAEDKIAQSDAEAFARGDGSFNRIENATFKNPFSGDDVEVKASARRDAAMEKFTGASRQKAIADKETPEQTFNREAEVFINNGVVREAWKKELDAIPGITNQTNLTDPTAIKRAVSGAQTYDALEQRSPAYARSLVDDKTRTFFQTFRVLKAYKTNPDGSPITDVQALNAAGSAIRNDGPDTASYVRDQIVEANNHIADLNNPNGGIGKGLWYMLGYDTKPAGNTAYLNTEMRRLSTAFIRAGGVGARDAVEMAAKELGKTGSVVNGQWMPKAGTMGLDFPNVSKRVIDNYTKSDFGKGHEASDLMLQSTQGGYYVLTDRSGIPVPGGGRYSHEDLTQVQRGMGDEKQREVIERQNATANEATSTTAPLRDMWSRNADEWVQRKHADKSPDEIIKLIESGKGGVFKESPLGRAILQQQRQRKAIK